MKKKLLFKQKLLGLLSLLISAAVILIASTGLTPGDKDISILFITVPVGIYMIFTKKIIIS